LNLVLQQWNKLIPKMVLCQEWEATTRIQHKAGDNFNLDSACKVIKMLEI